MSEDRKDGRDKFREISRGKLVSAPDEMQAMPAFFGRRRNMFLI
jgi:hypothetical protein